ncbi:MAG: tetratricopeptide repeat protein [Thermoanaerobaculia bacterium]
MSEIAGRAVRLARFVVGFSLITLPLTACSSGAGWIGRPAIPTHDLLRGTSLRLATPAAEVPSPEEVLAVTPEMRVFLDSHVDRRAAEAPRLRQLVWAIIDSGTFGVRYDDKTRTASETFRVREGNCLSFSTMFIAMARYEGLDVQYQEVDIPPDWTMSRDTFVLNQHVNVFVDLGSDGRRVVDFNMSDFRSTYPMRRISDQRAIAHYYNNIGVERMQAGDVATALYCFRKAVTSSGERYSPAWTNLGTLYLRYGDRAYAEAAYLQAIQVNSSDLVAMSDLARLYDLMGDLDRAAALQKRVVDHRQQNPYYRYELARRAYVEGEYDQAIRHLRFAIRKHPREDRFDFMMALCYFQKGDVTTAQRWMTRAEEVAATPNLKIHYSSKIDLLMRQSRR